MTLLELTAVVFSFMGVCLEVQRKILCWPVNIAASGFYLLVFSRAGLFADTGLQVLFIVLSSFGWWHWHQSEHQSRQRHLSINWCIFTFCLSVGLGTCLGYFLSVKTSDPAPYVDALLTTLSVLATIWMALKIRVAWLAWIFIDGAYVALFVARDLYLTSLLYLAFTLLAVCGWLRWGMSRAKE